MDHAHKEIAPTARRCNTTTLEEEGSENGNQDDDDTDDGVWAEGVRES